MLEGLKRATSRIAQIEQTLKRLDPPSQTPDFLTMMAGVTAPTPANMQAGILRGVSTPGDLDSIITQAASRYNIRPSLLRALVKQESGFNPNAVSPKGALGLTQLMPDTAAGLGVSDPFDPEQNVMGGAQYLRSQLDRFNGDETLALAAYNAGPAAVLRYHGMPPFPETQRYVNRVLSMANGGE